MQYRDSIYKAKIFERAQAQHIYDSVTNAGGNAALLVQERPNIFQQSLSNIAVGETAYVRIEVSMPLKYNNGMYELSVPTMIGERYRSSGVAAVPSSGSLWNPPENREGQTLQINALVQTGFQISAVSSPTHPLNITSLAQSRDTLVRRGVIDNNDDVVMQYNSCAFLQNVQTYPNRDYVLRFSRANAQQDFSLASTLNSVYGKGHFGLNVYPNDSLFNDGSKPNLEVVLMIDVSGSQTGWPLEKEKEIAQNILSRLLPTDKLSILAFSDEVYWAFGNQNPVIANASNIQIAQTFIAGLNTIGGTELYNAITSALAVTKSSEHERYYVFLTDGFITNEQAILDTIKNHPSKPTIFTFGAGGSLNRYFLEQCAKVGNGYATEITQYESTIPFVNDAWEKIESPQLKNVTVDFNGSETSELIMPRGSTLYKGSPLSMYGTYANGGRVTVNVKGYRNGLPITFSKQIDLANKSTCNRMVPQIWAKQKIEMLSLAEGVGIQNRDSIINISTQYQVLSKYTAFLAINPQPVGEDNSIANQMNQSFTEAKPDALKIKSSEFFLQCANGVLTLQLPKGEMLGSICLYSVTGKLVFEFKAANGSMVQKFFWDGKTSGLRNISAGRYVAVIKTISGKLYTKSIVWHS
jgi:Ca-activated chloride channel family protein